MKANSGRKVMWKVVVVALISILWTGGLIGPDKASAYSDACKLLLLSTGEIEAALGGKMGKLEGSKLSQDASLCSGKAGSLTVLIRTAQKVSGSGEKEKAGIEMASKMGAKVKVETHGNTTCSTSIPPANLAQYGYNTTCSVIKGGNPVAVEITAPSESQMVPSAKVRSLVEKAASRL